MNQKTSSLFQSLHVFFSGLINRRVHFLKKYSGKTLAMEDGKRFHVIRDLKVESGQSQGESVAVFKVRFKFSGLPLGVNKRLSIFPAPFLIAKSGFQEKIWAVSDDGYFQGLYQWASKTYADSYPESFIYKLMTKRSAEGTLSFEVLPDTVLSDYIDKIVL